MVNLDKKYDFIIVKLKLRHLIGIGIVVLFLGAAGVWNPLGIPENETAKSIWEQVDNTWNPEESKDPSDKVVNIDVVKMEVREGKGANEAGLGAGTASNQIVEIWHDNGGQPGKYFGSATASSGMITLYNVPSGMDIWVQGRQAAIASADPYVTPIVKRSVPSYSQIGNDDTVYLQPLYVRDVTGTAPTLAVEDGSGNTIDDNSADYFNTTDKTFSIDIHTIDADTFYGGENGESGYIIDYKTGEMYAYGVFFVWKGTTSQPFTTHDYFIPYDGSNVYYIWKLAPYLVDDSTADVSTDVMNKILQTDGSSLNADSTVILDIVDIILVGRNYNLKAILSGSDLIDGGGITPTAITTKVA